MQRYANTLAAMGAFFGFLLGSAAASHAQTSPVTAIDILLEPDATMLRRAQAANERLLKVFPKGFSLDEAHRPHMTTLQRYVRTADLDKLYTPVTKVLPAQKIASWKLKPFKYSYIPPWE